LVNRLRFDRIMVMNLWPRFFDPPCIMIGCCDAKYVFAGAMLLITSVLYSCKTFKDCTHRDMLPNSRTYSRYATRIVLFNCVLDEIQVIARRGDMPRRSRRIYVRARTDPQSAQLWWPAGQLLRSWPRRWRQGVRRFWLGGLMPPCRLRRRKF